jgi:spore maturation protein CgeB
MKLVIFGLSVSSSWGNGHATLWRGLLRALAKQHHKAVFFERDVPYYAANRDLVELPGVDLILYSSWDQILSRASSHVADADAVMVTSYCPDGAAASTLCLAARPGVTRAFYDLDTPITLERLRVGEPVPYLPEGGLSGFDITLSFTGGAALDELRSRLGARSVAPLYGSVDPSVHRRVPARDEYRADLSYLGTHAPDRKQALIDLFVEPARSLPSKRFVLGGSMYPADFPWTDNIWYLAHVPPPEHPAFYSSSRLTLNVTRGAMAAMGHCPSGRLFEAAACGAPIVSDYFPGLFDFFRDRSEIFVARRSEDVIDALSLSDRELASIAEAARARTLEEHTADRRARELVDLLSAPASAPKPLVNASFEPAAGGPYATQSDRSAQRERAVRS